MARTLVLCVLIALVGAWIAGCETRLDNPADPEAGDYIGFRPWVDSGDERRATIDDTLSFAGHFHGPQDKVERFTWDLDGDGGVDYESATYPECRWAYAETGIYRAVFSVWDRAGFSRRDTATVVVTNDPPLPDGGPDWFGFVGRDVRLPAGGTDDGRIVEYRWDYEADGAIDWTHAAPGTAVTVFEDPGRYTAVLEVVDDDNNSARDSVSVWISLGFPLAMAGPDVAVSIRDTVFFSGSGIDTNGTVVQYEWDFDGDGLADRTSGVSGAAAWVYGATGIRDAVLTVTDDEGYADRDTARVTVTDESPVIDAVDLGKVWCAEAETLSVPVVDDGRIVLYEWDFDGDGVFDLVSADAARPAHRYSLGDYRPVLRVTDDDGHTTTATLRVEALPWKAGPSMSIPRAGVGVEAVDDVLYALAGYSYGTGSYMAAAEAFDPEIGVWERRRPMSLAQFGLATTVLDGRIYGVAGCTREENRGAVEEYWPIYDLWSRKASVHVRRCWPVAATALGRIYVFGGTDDGEMDSVEALLLRERVWEARAPMPTARHGMAAVVVDELVYVIGGTGGGGPLGTVEVYDPVADVWQTKRPMPTPRTSLAAVEWNGKIYAIGGSYTSTVEVYDIATNTWYTGTPMQQDRYGHGAAIIGDRIYVVGGESLSGYLADMEIYAPAFDVLQP